MLKMKKCFICSPLQDDEGQNAARAARYCRDAMWDGFIPIAPHLFFETFLYDTHSDHIHVNNIIKAVLEECSEFRIFCDEVTEEMILEIKAAQKLGIQIKFYDADMREINYDALIINKKIGPGYKKIIAESHGDSYAGTVCPYAAECAKAGGAETSVPMEPAAAPSESSTEAEPAEEEKNSIGRRIQKWMEIFFTTV